MPGATLERTADPSRSYRIVTELPDSVLDLACALSMLRRLQMVGWTRNHYRDALPAGLADEQIPGTKVCAYRYLETPAGCWSSNYA